MQTPEFYNPVNAEVAKLTDAEKTQIRKMQDALEPGKITSVNLSKTKVWVETRENGKGMKITFKLNKEEAEGFNNIFNMLKPSGAGTDQFVKLLVFKGMEVYQKELEDRVEKYKKEHPEEFAKMQAEAMAEEESSIEPIETEDPKVDIIK